LPDSSAIFKKYEIGSAYCPVIAIRSLNRKFFLKRFQFSGIGVTDNQLVTGRFFGSGQILNNGAGDMPSADKSNGALL
jgi:hypothetical protein